MCLRIGIVRLETLSRVGRCLTSESSLIRWIDALADRVEAMGLVVPVTGRSSDAWERHPWSGAPRRFCPRKTDRLFALPKMAGYMRSALWLPVVATQLIRLRRWTGLAIVRVPEHAHWYVLPLMRLLQFHLFLWLVADRRSLEEAQRERRGTSLRVRMGLLISHWIGRVEESFLRRYPVIANGSALASYVRSLSAPSPPILEITSSVMRREDFPPPWRRPPSKVGPLELLYVGRLAPEKGLGDLIAALNVLLKQTGNDAAVLRIVGWPSHGERERVAAEIAARGLQRCVDLTGPKPFGPSLFRYYQLADVFVLPSRTEGSPRVLVEAMAFGLPVVATNVTGTAELVRHGENGLLVPPNKPEALAEALLTLLTKPSLREEMGAKGHERALSLSLEGVIEQMLSFVLKEVARGRPGAESSSRRGLSGGHRGLL